MNLIEADRDAFLLRVDRETGRLIRLAARKADQSMNHFLWRLIQRHMGIEPVKDASEPEMPDVQFEPGGAELDLT